MNAINVARLTLSAGDVLVVTCEKPLSTAGRNAIEAELHKACAAAGWTAMPAVVVLDCGMGLTVVQRAA